VGGVSSDPNGDPPSSSESTTGSGMVAYRERVWSGGSDDCEGERESMMDVE